MPRVEIKPSEPLRNGDGAPTIDLCKSCVKNFKVGEKVAVELTPQENVFGAVTELDVVHPPYENEEYRCDACKKPLTEEDN